MHRIYAKTILASSLTASAGPLVAKTNITLASTPDMLFVLVADGADPGIQASFPVDLIERVFWRY